MTDFVPNGGEVPFEIDVSGPNCSSIKSFEFVFTRASDGKPVETFSGSIDGSRMGSGTWTATGLQDDEMSCRVLWEAKAGELSALGRGEIVVYRDSIEVTTKDSDGAAVEKALVHVQVAVDRDYTEPCRTGTTRRTDGQGKVTIDDLPPGEVTVSIQTPFKLLEWVRDSGPVREAKIDKSYSACFVWPDLEALGEDPHKQYVNLPTDPSKPEQGSLMKIKAKVDLSTTPGGGITGDKIYLKVKWGDNNSERNDDPQPGIGNNVGGRGSGPFVVHEALTSDDGSVEFELELGAAGGDELEVWLGGDAACTDASFKLVSWRKVWIKPVKPHNYELPNDQLPDEIKQKINDTLLPVFIECAFESALTVNDRRAKLVDSERAEALGLPRPQLAPFVFFSNTGPEKLLLLDYPNDNPLRLYWLLANGLYKQHSETFRFKFTGRSSGWIKSASGNSFLAANPGGGPVLLPWRAAMKEAISKVSGKLMRATDAQPCYWEVVGNSKTTGPIDEGMLVFDSDRSKWKIKLPSDVGVGRKTEVRVNIKLHTYSFGAGSSTGNWVTACVKKHNLLGTVYTILHELGHSLGHVVADNSAAPGLPASHPHHYTGKGHKGPHCNYGLSTSNAAKDDYTPLVAKGTHGTCVMFGGVSSKTKFAKAMTFCPHCEPYVKAMKMESL